MAFFRSSSPIVLTIALSFGLFFSTGPAVKQVDANDDPTASNVADLKQAWEPFFDSYCSACHDGSDNSISDFTKTAIDLSKQDNFRHWEKLFDRVRLGEMPPASEDRPDEAEQRRFLQTLESNLTAESLRRQQAEGRVVLRRLTATEYEYTVNDLLGVQAELKGMIPAGSNSIQFDTVASNQGFSPLHARKFLEAADVAIDSAIRLDPKPESKPRRYDFTKHKLIEKHFDEDEQTTIGMTDDAAILFHNASYLYKLYDLPIQTGFYRIRGEAYSVQAKDRPVILTFNSGDYRRGFTEALEYFDVGPKPQTFETVAHLKQGMYLFPGVDDLYEVEGNGNIWKVGPEKYKGAGVALKWMEVEGPLFESWPPSSTTELLHGIEIKKYSEPRWNHAAQTHYQYEIVEADNAEAQLRDVVERFAKKAIRRPTQKQDIEPFVQLGLNALKNERGLETAIRISLKALLSSPIFLFHFDQPGPLDDYGIATRLSYFLWKTTPDQELRELAAAGKLTDPQTLRAQIERLLSDPKADRFIHDFADQWLRLSEIDATSPDTQLYPEYDELLKNSMLAETRAFIKQLVMNNMSTDQLVDSDFIMINRRLAEHYGIPGVNGQQIRKVELPTGSERGGVMTQASVLKVTANGTVTSPVRRGAWVLTHLLGTPPSPPPPDVGTIEPDTRGAKTIREVLAKHRSDVSCNSCHRSIDPPGFALESFDVIGGLRTRYRSKETGDRPSYKLRGRNIWQYRLGLPVDATGTCDGEDFQDIREFKNLLLAKRDVVARNVLEQLIVYSTGAEIQFADRKVIDELLAKCKEDDFGMKSMIREVILSPIFLNK